MGTSKVLQKSHVLAESGQNSISTVMQAPVAKRLEQIIEDALIGGPPDTPIERLTARVISENRELLEEFLVGYVSHLLVMHRGRLARRDQSRQLPLPGFERLPMRIPVEDGKRQPLEQATYRQLRQYLSMLQERHRNNPQAQQVRSLMGLVQKWRKKLRLKGKQTLTVGEAMEREAAQ